MPKPRFDLADPDENAPNPPRVVLPRLLITGLVAGLAASAIHLLGFAPI